MNVWEFFAGIGILCFIIIYCAGCLNRRLISLIYLMTKNNEFLKDADARLKKLDDMMGDISTEVNYMVDMMTEKYYGKEDN